MTNYHYSEFEYNGKMGIPRQIISDIISASEVSDSEITNGTAVQTGYLEFAAMGIKEGTTGLIKSILLMVNNDDTAAVAFTGRLHLFKTAPTTQTSGTALILSATDILNYLGYMDIDTTATNLTSFVSCSLTDTDFIYEGTAPNGYSYGNSTIYGILESTGNITFDSNVTITVYLKVEKD